ncbi:MAG: hypothetical protein C0P74_012935 [Gammaproteobacteria bacterium]
MTSPSPVIGAWYSHQGTLFEVVAIDPEDGTVEVQYFDGTLDEMDLESWADEEIEEVEAPDDWTGPVDIEPEDYDEEREAPAGSTWSDPLIYLDRSEASGYSEWPTPSGY